MNLPAHPQPLRESLIATLLLLTAWNVFGVEPSVPPLSSDDRQQIERDLQVLSDKLAGLHATAPADRVADAELFHKGITWALRYETNFAPNDVVLLKKSLSRGLARADALLANKAPWIAKNGKVLRGFTSAVDGSTQPYGVIVPASYDGTKPMRLDVVLHGSSKPVGSSELRFGARRRRVGAADVSQSGS